MRSDQLVRPPSDPEALVEPPSRVMVSYLFGQPVRGRALVAVADRWERELLAMLPFAERHTGDVHFAPTGEGPGLRPCSVDLLVVDPAVARVEALRPALARGGALAVVGPGGAVRWTRERRRPRTIGRLRGARW